MDNYFYEATQLEVFLELKDLYLLGLASIWIASKTEEVNYISLKCVERSLG